MRPAAWLDAYPYEPRAAIERAAADGFFAIQVNLARPEYAPESFGRSAERHFARFVDRHGLRIDALAVWLPGGLAMGEPERRLETLTLTLRRAQDWRVPRVVTRIQGIADGSSLAMTLLEAAADRADACGVELSLFGPDSAGDWLTAFKRLGCPALSRGIDLLEIPREEIALQTGRIGAVHVRDGRRTTEGIEETPIGRGELDLPGLIADVTRAGYEGLFALRCDAARFGFDAMRAGRQYMERIFGRSADREGRS